jgi:hypothetical protein
VQDFPGVAELANLRRWATEVGARPAVVEAIAWGKGG